MTTVTLQDRQDIADLMTGWMYRDTGDWTGLAGLFHEGATIKVTWFDGLAEEFIRRSQRMGGSNLETKHVVTAPVVRFNDDRAIAETNAMIVAQNASLGLGAVSHNRFYDRIERRNGVWKIVQRDSIYDFGAFEFPLGPVAIDGDAARRFPIAYAPLAYLLEVSGYPVVGAFATKGDDLEASLKREGQAWLDGAA